MSIRQILSAAVVALATLQCTAAAQGPAGLTVKRAGRTIFTDSAALDKNLRRLIRNDTAILQIDSAYLIGANALGTIGEYKKKMDSLEALRKELDKLRGQQASKHDTVGMKWKAVDSIQSIAYDSLFKLNKRGDSLLTRSIRNTDEAISTARAIRRQSYFTATILGGVAGLVTDKSILGGGIGAAAGFVLNGCLLKFEF
jgi:hypothetical protein